MSRQDRIELDAEMNRYRTKNVTPQAWEHLREQAAYIVHAERGRTMVEDALNPKP